MKSKAESARLKTLGAGLALALFLSGTARAEDTPAAAETPSAPVAHEATAPAGVDSTAQPTPAADLSYQRETYFYVSSSLRDPFGSLIEGNFVSDASSRLPDVGSIELLGVMWGDSDRFAMVEDREGNGYVLRVGDPVVNGEVSGITRDSVTIRQFFFGTSTTVTLKLKPREGRADAKNKRR